MKKIPLGIGALILAAPKGLSGFFARHFYSPASLFAIIIFIFMSVVSYGNNGEYEILKIKIDDTEFDVPRHIAWKIPLIKNMLETVDNLEEFFTTTKENGTVIKKATQPPLPLAHVPKDVFRNILNIMNHADLRYISDEKFELAFANIFKSLNMNSEDLLQLIITANYLGIKPLLNAAVTEMAKNHWEYFINAGVSNPLLVDDIKTSIKKKLDPRDMVKLFGPCQRPKRDEKVTDEGLDIITQFEQEFYDHQNRKESWFPGIRKTLKDPLEIATYCGNLKYIELLVKSGEFDPNPAVDVAFAAINGNELIAVMKKFLKDPRVNDNNRIRIFNIVSVDAIKEAAEHGRADEVLSFLNAAKKHGEEHYINLLIEAYKTALEFKQAQLIEQLKGSELFSPKYILEISDWVLYNKALDQASIILWAKELSDSNISSLALSYSHLINPDKLKKLKKLYDVLSLFKKDDFKLVFYQGIIKDTMTHMEEKGEQTKLLNAIKYFPHFGEVWAKTEKPTLYAKMAKKIIEVGKSEPSDYRILDLKKLLLNPEFAEQWNKQDNTKFYRAQLSKNYRIEATGKEELLADLIELLDSPELKFNLNNEDKRMAGIVFKKAVILEQPGAALRLLQYPFIAPLDEEIEKLRKLAKKGEVDAFLHDKKVALDLWNRYIGDIIKTSKIAIKIPLQNKNILALSKDAQAILSIMLLEVGFTKDDNFFYFDLKVAGPKKPELWKDHPAYK